MTITISLAGAGDAGVYSRSANYATCLAGAGLTMSGATTFITWGQSYNYPFVGEYVVDQAFFDFPYTYDANALLNSAYFELTSDGALSATQARNMEIREYDWGASVDTADWRSTTAFQALPVLGQINHVETASAGNVQRGGGTALIGKLNTPGVTNVRVCISSDRFTYQQAPSTDERSHIRSADYSGTSEDPALVYTTTPLHTLNRVLGAQVQLSDGSHAVLENLAAEAITNAGNIKLRRVDAAGTATDIATLSLASSGSSFAIQRGGAQSFALAKDANDNLYVISRQAGATSALCAQAFVKGGGMTWAAATRLTANLADYQGGYLEQWTATWQSVGGTAGTLFLATAGIPGSDSALGSAGSQLAFLSCDSLLAGTGTLLRGTAAFGDCWIETTNSDHSYWQNETLTGLDVMAAPGQSRVGYAFTYNADDGRNYMDPAVSRYKLNASGTGLSSAAVQPDEWDLGTVVRDAGSKLRVVGIDGTRFAIAGGAYPFYVLQVASDSSSQVRLGRASLATDITVASKPTAIYNTQTWDVVYDSGGGRLWFYYIDASRRLVRTSFNLSTYLPNNDEIIVSAAVGAVGSTNYAIRCTRGALTTGSTLVTVANKTSGGAHSTIYITDTFNIAPNAPTLTPKTNFDATATGAFAWTFSDPNVGDTQSAFELDIDTAAGAHVFDTGRQLGQVSYVGAGTSSTANNANVTPGLPAGVAEGDWVVVVASIQNSGTGTVNLPAGWTDLVNFGNVRAFVKRYTATGFTMPTVAFTGGAAGADTIGQSFAVRGAHQDVASLLSAAATTVLNGSAQNIATPAYTPAHAGCLAVTVAWKQDDATSYATPAGWTAGPFDSVTAGNDASQGVFHKQQGAVLIAAGSVVVTGGAAAISRGLVFAFRPHTGNTGGTFTLPANILTNGTSYQWRAKTWDAAGAEGAWSGFGTFSAAAGGTVTVTDPAADNPAGVIRSSYLIAWSVASTVQQDYRVVVLRNDTAATILDTGWVTSVATTYNITGMISDVEHTIQVTVRNAALVVSATGTRLITPSFSTPEQPTISVVNNDAGGYITVAVTNPTPTGDKPEVTGNQILRRLADTTDAYVAVGTCDPDGSYADYAVASGTLYEYVARGVAPTGTKDSASATGSLTLTGVWLHDPLDAPTSVRQYIYGKAARSNELDVMGQGTFYAGREFPVFDFGEYSQATVTVKIQVPHGTDWATELAELAAFAELRRTVCFRDNRGRRAFGAVGGFGIQDEEWGSTVTFTVATADYDEAVA